MRLISLDAPESKVWVKLDTTRRFIPLGATEADCLHASAIDRLARRTAGPTQDVWGTLGAWDDCSPEGWRGVLRISQHGTEASKPMTSGVETLSLIDSVLTTTSMPIGARVRERFIDLSDLSFDTCSDSYTLSTQPSLRLTLFVRPDEGALVFLQHGPLGEAGVDFVTPEPTGPSHSCSGRDRLSYRIPVPFEAGWAAATPTEHGDVALRPASRECKIAPNTALKILTFQRTNSPSHEVVRRALARLGRDKSQLLRWDLREGMWRPVASAEVRRDAKTLLLVHGTFSSTSGGFAELSEHGAWSWIQNTAIARQRYQQVLAFDHDTVLEDLQTNAARLHDALGGVMTRPVDVVAHSRGGLLAKHLAIRAPFLEVERAALVACANGVGYMRAARNIARFLSIMRRLLRFSGPGEIVVALAQHSVEFISKLPGLEVMTPNSDALNEVLATPVPAGRAHTTFLPIVGDYDRSLVEKERFFERMAMNGLDLIIKAILGGHHDWVVGSANQAIVAPGHLAPSALDRLSTWHTGYFGWPQTRDAIGRFLVS